VGGSKSVQTISYNIDKNTDIIWGHSYDYEIHHYNNNDLNTTLNIQPYALFLDQYWPFHSNFPPQKITPEYYYNKLNDFFCHIEEKFNLSIIIAGHPERKKLGKSSEQYFVHRKVIYDKTYALVLNAQFIIAHFSTSINYAVMSYKPIMFIYLDTLPEFCIEHTCYLSELYDQPLYNISNNSYKNNINGIWNINKHTYDIRINDYIKTNKSPQKGLHDILADYLDSRIIK